MVAPLRPAPAKLFGRKNYVYIPTIASATLAPTVAEITAASTLDITRIAFAGGEPTINATTNRIRMDRRIGDTQDYEQIGTTSWEGGDIVMAWQPQGAAGSDGKKAWEKFLESTTGFVAKREDVGRDADFAAGQFLSWVAPIEFGPRIPVEQGEGESGQAAFRSTIAITGAPAFAVAVLI